MHWPDGRDIREMMSPTGQGRVIKEPPLASLRKNGKVEISFSGALWTSMNGDPKLFKANFQSVVWSLSFISSVV
jgi:hypothetical protein